MKQCIRDYKALLAAGNKAQMEKLEQNGHKEGFDDLEIKYVYKRLKQEMKELWKEIYSKPFLLMLSFIFPRHYTNYRATKYEFADIANFAHMGIMACDKEINNV